MFGFLTFLCFDFEFIEVSDEFSDFHKESLFKTRTNLYETHKMNKKRWDFH